MVFNNLKIKILLNILLILSCQILIFIAVKNSLFFLTFFLVISLIGLVFNIFRLVDNSNRKITNLLSSIHFNDAQHYLDYEDDLKSLRDLSDAYETLKKNVQKLKLEKEEHNHYLNFLIEQVKVGIFIYENDTIKYLNDYAKNILQISHIKKLTELYKDNQAFYNFIIKLKENQKEIFSENSKQYSVEKSKLIFKDKSMNFITIHDIKSELEEQEIESWTKLIRILTHEIMNSISPITSLSSTIYAIISSEDELNDESIESLKLASSTICKRSSGLLKFVDSFRNMLKIPQPVNTEFSVQMFFTRLENLISDKIKDSNINISFNIINQDLNIYSDENLLEQCILNLLFNAIDAVTDKKNPEIIVIAEEVLNNYRISVIDNAGNLKQGNIDKIFIPFFTTKKSGNGIGLSIVKQILRKLNADIKVFAEEDIQTKFIIELKKISS